MGLELRFWVLTARAPTAPCQEDPRIAVGTLQLEPPAAEQPSFILEQAPAVRHALMHLRSLLVCSLITVILIGQSGMMIDMLSCRRNGRRRSAKSFLRDWVWSWS